MAILSRFFHQASDDDVDPRKHLDIGPAEVVDCPVSVSHLVETISVSNEDIDIDLLSPIPIKCLVELNWISL